MSRSPDSASSAAGAVQPAGTAARHETLNEIHALILGARLLMEQLDAGELNDARQTCAALLESAQRLKTLHQAG